MRAVSYPRPEQHQQPRGLKQTIDQAALVRALQRGPYQGVPDHIVLTILRYCQEACLDPFRRPLDVIEVSDSRHGKVRALLVPRQKEQP